jgi:hypothetical protein
MRCLEPGADAQMPQQRRASIAGHHEVSDHEQEAGGSRSECAKPSARRRGRNP